MRTPDAKIYDICRMEFMRNITGRLLTVAVLLLPAAGLQAQSKTNTDQQIIRLGKLILTKDLSGKNMDSLDNWNEALERKILGYADEHPDFMQADFKKWSDAGIYMVTATDQKLRVVFWNNQTGGTLREYTSVVFWKGSGGLRGRTLTGFENADFTGITVHLKKSGGVFYLLRGMSHGSNIEKVDFISAMAISGDHLNDNYTAFKIPKSELHEITVYINLNSVKSEEDYIHFSSDRQLLYIPAADKNGNVKTGLFLVYRYDGNQYVFEQTRKK